jgi:hypothetical protein
VGRLKNISGEALNVPALGLPGSPRHVEPDEIVDVPAELADSTWDPALWQDVPQERKTKSKGGEG